MFCLVDDIITEVVEEEIASGLWLKLEILYMTQISDQQVAFEATSVQPGNE